MSKKKDNEIKITTTFIKKLLGPLQIKTSKKKDEDWYSEFITKKDEKLFEEVGKYVGDQLNSHEISPIGAAVFFGKSLFVALKCAHHFGPPRDRDKFAELLKGITAEIQYLNRI